jgi:hypothetical protein
MEWFSQTLKQFSSFPKKKRQRRFQIVDKERPITQLFVSINKKVKAILLDQNIHVKETRLQL